jgi:thioredoxin 1
MEIVNKEQFQKIISSNEIVLVDMFAEWCGPCKMLSPVLEQVAAMYPKVKIIKVDVDKEPTLAQNFSIQSVPTVMFFYNGELKQKLMGFNPKDRFIKLLEPII